MRSLTPLQRSAGAFSVLLVGLVAAIPGWELYTALYRGYVYIGFRGGGFYATYAYSKPTFYFGITFGIALLSPLIVCIAILLFGIVTGRLPNRLMAPPKPDPDSTGDEASEWEMRCRTAIDSEVQKRRAQELDA